MLLIKGYLVKHELTCSCLGRSARANVRSSMRMTCCSTLSTLVWMHERGEKGSR